MFFNSLAALVTPDTSPSRPTRDAARSSSGLFGLRGLVLCLTATTGAAESSDAVQNTDAKHIGDAVSMYWLVGILLAVLALVLVTGAGDGSLYAHVHQRDFILVSQVETKPRHQHHQRAILLCQ